MVATSPPSTNKSLATRCTSSADTLSIAFSISSREMRHAARRALESEHQAALQMIFRASQLVGRDEMIAQVAQLGKRQRDDFFGLVRGAAGVDRHRARIA